MKKHLYLLCGALAAITIQHFSAFAETAKPDATATPPAAISPSLKAIRRQTFQRANPKFPTPKRVSRLPREIKLPRDPDCRRWKRTTPRRKTM